MRREKGEGKVAGDREMAVSNPFFLHEEEGTSIPSKDLLNHPLISGAEI